VIAARPVTVGELVERFADQIPLHSAARKWSTRRHGDADIILPSADKMRFYMLTQYLHWLKCEFEPTGRKTHQTWVRAPGRVCERCGSLFVPEKTTRTCGKLCRGLKAQ
jgi:hypothetical protein